MNIQPLIGFTSSLGNLRTSSLINYNNSLCFNCYSSESFNESEKSDLFTKSQINSNSEVNQYEIYDSSNNLGTLLQINNWAFIIFKRKKYKRRVFCLYVDKSFIRNQDREMLSIVIPFGKGKTYPLKFASIDRKKSFLDNIGFNYDYLKEYSFIKEIAKGTYGSIYLATKDSKEYSIKLIKKKNNVTQQLRREIYINQFLTQHKHNNIINVYDVYETGDYVYIIMEHITTQNFTSKNYQDFFNSNQSIKESYMHQLIEGVNFLHENGIIHRDIKFDNILIQNTKELSIKIIDFGLSILLCKGEQTKEGCGTLLYSAPEIIYNQPYNYHIDLWSIGIISFVLSYNKFPITQFHKSEYTKSLSELQETINTISPISGRVIYYYR